MEETAAGNAPSGKPKRSENCRKSPKTNEKERNRYVDDAATSWKKPEL